MNLLSSLRSRYAFIQGNFLILLISWVLMFFSGPIPSTYSSLYFKGLGANDFMIGVIGFAGSMALAFVQFPGGLLADQHGRRWLVVTMTFGVTFAIAFFIFAPSWHWIVLGTAIQNFCLLYQPALFAIMIDSVSPEHRGTGFTLQFAVTNLVSLPAAIIAGYLILAFDVDLGTRIAYLLVLIFYLAAALLRTKLKETLTSNNNASPSRPMGSVQRLSEGCERGASGLEEGAQGNVVLVCGELEHEQHHRRLQHVLRHIRHKRSSSDEIPVGHSDGVHVFELSDTDYSRGLENGCCRSQTFLPAEFSAVSPSYDHIPEGQLCSAACLFLLLRSRSDAAKYKLQFHSGRSDAPRPQGKGHRLRRNSSCTLVKRLLSFSSLLCTLTWLRNCRSSCLLPP